jgi:uncharacterized membrane protein YfcA
VINAVAGGGSLLSFPALLLTGMPPVAANATNTVAIWPGTVSAAWAYRRYIGEERRRAFILAWPSLLGGLVGSVLLIHSPEKAFQAVVPWLILFACALLALQKRIAAFVASRTTEDGAQVPPALWAIQFAIAVYGGYFGAGIGILMLAAMAVFLPSSLQHANALKVLFALLINLVAAIYFIAIGAVHFPEAALMAAASLTGGLVGSRLAQRLSAGLLRGLVVAYGAVVAGWLLWKG